MIYKASRGNVSLKKKRQIFLSFLILLTQKMYVIFPNFFSPIQRTNPLKTSGGKLFSRKNTPLVKFEEKEIPVSSLNFPYLQFCLCQTPYRVRCTPNLLQRPGNPPTVYKHTYNLGNPQIFPRFSVSGVYILQNVIFLSS